MYTLIGVMQYDTPEQSCDHCGHAIAQVFTMYNDENGSFISIGCDCFQQFATLGGLNNETKVAVEKKIKRLKRAARQWKQQKPPANPSETRADYINRRMVEMGNALPAFKHWQALFAGTTSSLYSYALKQLVADGYTDPGKYLSFNVKDWQCESLAKKQTDAYCKCEFCLQRQSLTAAWQELVKQYQVDFIDRFERKYQANHFDFNRAIWDVRKV